jgi:hypothetical protein
MGNLPLLVKAIFPKGDVMKLKFLMLAALSGIFSGNVMAEANSGFGINIGGSGNYMASTYTVGTVANPVGSTYNYNSSGSSLGIDYQIAFPNNLTLNPFLIVSNESTNLATQTGATMAHNVLGLQGRLWKGDFFLGVHGALYTETIATTAGTNIVSETGNGQGLAVGWEPSKGRWSIVLQGDSAKFKYPDQDVTMTGARLSLGYRWK